MWFLLLTRDFFSSVVSLDATPGTSAQFFSINNGISAVAALLLVAAGGFLFVLARRTEVSRRYGRGRRRHHRSKSAAPVVAVSERAATVARPAESHTETVSFDVQHDTPEAGLPVDGLTVTPMPASPQRVRIKKRIRVRIRKDED